MKAANKNKVANCCISTARILMITLIILKTLLQIGLHENSISNDDIFSPRKDNQSYRMWPF